MTILTAVGWTLLRAFVCSLVTVPFASAVQHSIQCGSRMHRTLPIALLAVVFATPELLIGYAYADTWLSLVQYPAANESLYTLLLAIKLTPAAVVLLCAVPASPLCDSGWHCFRCIHRGHPLSTPAARLRETVEFLAQGPWRRFGPTGLLVFLLAFQDFELAARMGVRSWTVQLFDLHVREGMRLTESLWLTLWPVVCECVVITAVYGSLARGASAAAAPNDERPLSRRGAVICVLLLFLAVLLTTVVPAVVVLQETLVGLRGVLKQQVDLPREIGIGMGVAAFAAVLAWMVSGLVAQRGKRIGVLLLIPGLMGPLVLSLVFRSGVLALDGQLADRLPALVGRGLASTPVPLILALALYLLPRAWLMRWLLDSARPRSPGHLAKLLQAGEPQRSAGAALSWEVAGRSRFWSSAVLAQIAFWDLTTLTILAPIGFVSAPVRLYNFMHYRHYPFISAMLCITVLVPIATAAIVAALLQKLAAVCILRR